ncbi:hypothetical protein [Mycobacterium sp. 3519A]|jgi:hypothetical protein|uniref:hypothetical protein n=1 Tax=Mycobacterium sp. 3519A TaxID=2057184 RepID=UPI000C7AA6DC|nr:hypothetical protein [Mycobacterium sp. 3519A]
MTVTTEPRCLHTLLDELGVKHVSVEKQLPALRAWLATHTPSQPLRVSMCCNGYGLLLKESSAIHN